ncbi:hypothetical protein CU097_006840 [Rhizopus azygosporus]|uniref:Uncharacterized protein n=1 Tax=Rhizopus azygosporus TaxID=86630 RepID=A0A367J485_RHIAZ|nr:hypothetical protein CU097_006840 [Rhizopus azygosporus]
MTTRNTCKASKTERQTKKRHSADFRKTIQHQNRKTVIHLNRLTNHNIQQLAKKWILSFLRFQSTESYQALGAMEEDGENGILEEVSEEDGEFEELEEGGENGTAIALRQAADLPPDDFTESNLLSTASGRRPALTQNEAILANDMVVSMAPARNIQRVQPALQICRRCKRQKTIQISKQANSVDGRQPIYR